MAGGAVMTHPNIMGWVEEYLALRRGLGFDRETPAWYLRSLARYAEQVGHRGPITVDLATRWALATRSKDPAQAARRLKSIRPFIQHRALIDRGTEIPTSDLLGRIPRRKQPHIYSDAEIAAMLEQAGHMLPRRGLNPKTYVTFFSLLLSTGLRLSEACHLTCSDVDLDRGLLTIRGSKFRKYAAA
jgi:integrase